MAVEPQPFLRERALAAAALTRDSVSVVDGVAEALPLKTESAIERAGFAVERCTRFAFKPFSFPFPTAPHVLGVARRTA